MDWSDTRYPDGSYRYFLPPDNSHQRLRSEEVLADWQSPADVPELLGRVYPDGAPEVWTRFYAGEEIEEADGEKIRAALKPHAQKPSDSGFVQDQTLLKERTRIERGLQDLAWLDVANEEDHWQLIRHSAGHVAEKASERAALEMQKKSVDHLFELRRDEIRAERRRANDLHLLYLLAEAIVAPSRHTGFPDEYLSLLPAETAKGIELYRVLEARRAEEKRQAEETSRLRQIGEKERETIERLAFVETASFDDLLDLLFGHNPDSSILDSFRRRERLTSSQLDVLIDLKDTPDPVRRRGYERLFELGSSVGIAVLSVEEIEELQALRQREEEEAKERETQRVIGWIEEASWPSLCAEAAARGLVPQEWMPWLHRVTDIERVYQVRDHFAASAGRVTDPVNKRICELLSSRALSRNQGMAGAVGMLG